MQSCSFLQISNLVGAPVAAIIRQLPTIEEDGLTTPTLGGALWFARTEAGDIFQLSDVTINIDLEENVLVFTARGACPVSSESLPDLEVN